MKDLMLINGDCEIELDKINTSDKILVIDPPFNIGYHYNEYKDKRTDYLDWLGGIVSKFDKFVLIHYPEDIFKLAIKINKAPTKTVSWVYNSNTAKQHRMIAFFGFKPDFNKVRQPYKNLNDKRIQERIKNGSKGARLYDWWEINQVKNVSKCKTNHPCQMPKEVMDRVVGILPDDYTVVDCFMGSGTTGVSCVGKNIPFIGIELDELYFEISKKRILDAKRFFDEGLVE